MKIGIKLLIPTVLLFTGCIKDSPEALNNYVDKMTDKNISKTTDWKISSQFKEVRKVKSEIDISMPKSLKMVLEELQSIDGRIYLLKEGSKNPEIPKNSKFRIKNFRDLKDYLESTTQYTLDVGENKYRLDLPKIIKVLHKDSVDKNIQKYSFPLSIKNGNGQISAKDALVEVSQDIGFSLIFKYSDFKDVKGQTTNSNINDVTIFDNTAISFYGDNLADFFSYIEDSFGVFVDVDYSKKQIKISKIKTNFLNIVIPDIKIRSNQVNNTATGGSNNGTGGEMINGKTVQSELIIHMYEELEKKLDKIFKSPNSLVAEEYYDINNNNGEIVVVAGRDKLQKAREVVDVFNSAYKKSVYVDFRIYEILVYKTDSLGTSLTGGDGNFNISANTGITSIASLLQNKHGMSITAALESIHKYGYITGGYQAYARIINNIPKSLKLTTADEYISNIIDNTTTSNGAVNTQVSSESSTLLYGKTIMIMPRVFNDSCVLEIDYEAAAKPKLDSRVIGTNTIEVAQNKEKKSYRDMVRLRENETVLLTVIQDTQLVSDYSGMIPIDNFIIGGSSGQEFLKKEIVFIVSLKDMVSN